MPQHLNTELPSPDTPPAGVAERREAMRRRLLRANTAVAVLIASTLVLAMLALWQSLRATRLQTSAVANQQRAEIAEGQARSELWRALLTEARATRRGSSLSRREEALEALRRAAAITPALELRHEAIAALALPEDRVEAILPLDPAVRSYEFDSEMRQVAVGLTNGEVVIYQLPDLKVTRRLRLADGPVPENQDAALTLSFSPNGDALAVRYFRGALAVWDLKSGRMRWLRDADQVRRPASRGLFSSDGSVLVAPVFSPDGFAAINAMTGETLRHFAEFSSFHHCAVRPGATQFAVFADEKISVMDWTTGRKIGEHPCPEGARIMAWSADGVHLAMGGGYLHVTVWDVARGTTIMLTGLKDSVGNLHFDPGGNRLAAVTSDVTSYLWELPGTRPVSVFEGQRFLRWGPSGLTGWAVPKQRVELRRLTVKPTYARLAGDPEQTEGSTMDISPDGNWAVSKAYPEGLFIWNLEHPAPPEFVALTNVQSLCFHPVEPKLLLLRGHRLEGRDVTVVTAGDRRSLILGAPTSLTRMTNRLIDLVTLSASGQTRAYVETLSGRVWVEHLDREPALVEIQQVLHSSVEHRSGSARGTGTIALSPDGRWLVVATDGQRGTGLYDARTGGRVKTLDELTGGVQFSPDGRWLAFVGSRYGRVFRTSDWALQWSVPGDLQRPSYASAAAFSPDGSTLALAASSTRTWLVETETGRELGMLEAPDAAPIRTARWSKDGRRLVLATRDNALDVWHPDALRSELAKVNLDWNAPAAAPVSSPPRATMPPVTSTKWIAFILLGATGAAGFVALGFLKRHRRLIEEFSDAETLVLRRGEELRMQRELSELKSQFVNTVSHEFRTPLGVIMASAENLRDYHERFTPAQRAESLRDIFDATRTMSGLMEEVLLLGRVESGKVTFRPEPLELPALCERFIDEVRSATEDRCPIEFHHTPSDRPARGDEGLLRHILVNLITNAVKYSPPGRRVELRVEPREAFAVLTLRDHGIGIPPEDLPHLFDAFHRGRNVGDTPGSGLGLVIVKRCVDLHGGSIECRSIPGEGTTFTVRLPLFMKLS